MSTSCEVRVEQRGEAAVLVLQGDVTGEANARLTAGYESAVAGHQPQRMVLDFTDVSYINSTGIALIVGLLGRARADDRAVAAAGLSEHYRQIFEITRLSDFIEVCPDVDTAVNPAVSAG